MEDAVIILISILVAFFLTIFNFITVAIAIVDHKLRGHISHYPVISFLIATTFQGAFAAPITIFKQLEHKHHITGWLCDISRLSYYICHHLVKISLVIVSFDRLFTIKCPFKYSKFGTKRNMLSLLGVCWVITLIIDMLPFIHEEDDEMCHYVINKRWMISIILIYNIAPFILITNNYIYIWSIAAKVALVDRRLSTSLRRSSVTIENFRSRKKSSSFLDRRKASSFKNKGKFQFMLELKATKTSLALIGVYVICWGPLGVYDIVEKFCSDCLLIDKEDKEDIHDGLMYLCFSSNILAPVFYCWLNRDYRKAGKRIMRRMGLLKTRSVLTRIRAGAGFFPEEIELEYNNN